MKRTAQEKIAIIVQNVLAGDVTNESAINQISDLVTQDDGTAEVGDVVQISPEFDSKFPACFMVVTEVKAWGVQGYIEVPGESGGVAYFRCETKNYVVIGKTEWALPS